jgi:hypothetical protein
MLSRFLRSHVRVGLAIATGSLGAIPLALGAYHAGQTDGLVASRDAQQAVIGSYADELLTQAVRIYEDGSVIATSYHWDGTDLVPTEHQFCVDGALCDDDEPTTVGPGA